MQWTVEDMGEEMAEMDIASRVIIRVGDAEYDKFVLEERGDYTIITVDPSSNHTR